MSISPSFLAFIIIGIVSELTFRSDTIYEDFTPIKIFKSIKYAISLFRDDIQ